MLWSLIASAQRHEIDVQLYLRSVLAHLPGLSPEELPNYLRCVEARPDGSTASEAQCSSCALARGIVK